jgi:hypothetical protein
VLEATTVYGKDQILVPAVQHSGSYYLVHLLGGVSSKLKQDGMVSPLGKRVIHGHYDCRHAVIKELSKRIKTVIPVRHPAMIAVSWKKRGPKQWRTDNFLIQWQRMHDIDGFLFCIEQKPFDRLEEYLGTEVNRTDAVIHSIGDYPEKQNLETARDFLADDWSLVTQALDTPIGRKFYAETIRRL